MQEEALSMTSTVTRDRIDWPAEREQIDPGAKAVS